MSLNSTPIDLDNSDTAEVYQELSINGYCVVRCSSGDVLKDASEIMASWFAAPEQAKKAAISTVPEIEAGCGRGWLVLPDKEVLEAGAGWRPEGVRPDVRLAANTAFNEMKQVACKVLQLLFTSVNGLHASQEQLHGWTQQQRHSNPAQAAGAAAAAAPGSTSCHSMLHISSYQPVPAAAGSVPTVTAAAAGDEQRVCLRGCEAHVDRGLLTVIAASQPGLQVLGRDASWEPVDSTDLRHLVVLVGHTLSFATAGRLPAALHRIVIPPPNQGGSLTAVTPAAAAAAAATGPSPAPTASYACSSNGGGLGGDAAAAAAVEDAAGEVSQAPLRRLSLAFKLRAAPGCVFDPAAVVGASRPSLAARYRVAQTCQQLMAAFEASHLSVNTPTLLPIKREPLSGAQQPDGKRQCTAPPAAAAAIQATAVGKQQEQPQMQPQQQPKQPLQQQIPAGAISCFVEMISGDRRTRFHVQHNAKMGKVMTTYLQHIGMDPAEWHSFRWIMDGVSVKSYQTVLSLGLEEDDVIMCCPKVVGD